MRKSIKRAFAAVLALAMTCASFTVPVFADDYTPLFDGDTVLNEWKFDFGSKDDVAEGYTAVTPDRNYITEKDYGFIGIDENAYKVGNRADGFGNQEGQVINLQTGGGTGLYDGIGSVGEDLYGNAGDKYYPVRFALKVGDEKYFRIRATVTTLDPEKDANVTLYTERKHPIVKNKTLAGGEHYTVDFSIRTTPIYYEKSSPKGSIADEMVNVCVLGENSALAALEIQEVESFPTMWVLGDSTVTDGNTVLPYFEPQNYTGVGTGLTMYLPRNIAMVNEGEGGLAAGDNAHFNMVKDRIKAGDYMYVEYGHNHKDGDTTGYLSCLDKYYNKCKEVGAKLLIVSPIERINTFSDGAYQQTLNGFADVGEQYVAEKVAAGAEDIAYVDLNDFSIKWYNEITTANGGSASAIKYYFQTAKGGSTDQTHPNDKGAEWLAYKFMQAAQAVTDETQKAVVQGFLTNMTDEEPTLISEEITAGAVGGPTWPTYIVPVSNKYPVVIKDIAVAEDGSVSSADVEVQQAEFAMSAYGIIVITVSDENGIEKGKIYAVDQVDNSTGYGEQKIVHFTGDIKIAATDTYTAVVMQALDLGNSLKVDEEANKAYSPVYTPTDIAVHLITDEDGNGGEDFDYYGAVYEGDSATNLNEKNNWNLAGSAGKNVSLGIDGKRKYTNLQTDGAKNGSAKQGSFYVWKNLNEKIGTTGKYMISADMKYLSGEGMEFKLAQGVSDKVPWGTDGITAFTVGSNGVVTSGGNEVGTISAVDFTNVKWILDMDRATATVTVGGGDPVEYEVSNYATTEMTVTPTELTSFHASLNKAACAVQMSNLVVAKLKDTKLPEYKVEVGTLESESAMGTAEIMPLPTPVPTAEPTVTPTEKPPVATVTPTPTEKPPVVTPTPTPTVTTAPLHDCSAENPVEDGLLCSNYKVLVSAGADDCDFEYEKLSLMAYSLEPHENAEHTLGYWVGAAVTAPEGTTIDGYYFSTAKYNGAFEQTAEDDKQTIEFYVNAADLYKVVWAAVKLSDDRIFVYRIDVIGVVQGGGDVTFEAATLHDCSAENPIADEDLYESYSIAPNQYSGYKELIVTAKGLKKHENANNVSGYWVGAAITAPAGTTIDGYYFSADEYNADRTFTATGEDDKQTIEFYVNAEDTNPKKWVAVKLNTGRVCVYKFDLTDVEFYSSEDSNNDSGTDLDNADVQTMTALFDDNAAVTVAYEGNTVKLTAAAGCKAVLLEAVYDENGFLVGLYPTTFVFDKAETKEHTVRNGCKVMVWDSLESAKPLAPSHTTAPAVPSPTATATPTPPAATATPTLTPTPTPTTAAIVVTDTEESVTINTVITVKATSNEGYVFMGWKDEDNKLVSSEAEYSFRLRNDVKLYADFAKEPGVETIANYTLSAVDAFVKAAEGSTTTMKITDCVDSANTPFTKVKNTDAQWTCAETGITVSADGVVTVGADFSMGDSIEKEVIIKSVLNGVEKTYALTLHTYNIYEDFSNVTDTWGFTTNGGVNVTDGVLNLLVNSNANGNSVQTKTLDADITASKKVVAKFDVKFGIESSKGRNSYFALNDSNGNNIFMVYADGRNGLFYSTTGTDSTTKFAGYSTSWYTVNVTADFETNKVAATISDASGKAVATIAETDITTGAANLGQLYATNTYSVAPLSVDNVMIKAY